MHNYARHIYIAMIKYHYLTSIVFSTAIILLFCTNSALGNDEPLPSCEQVLHGTTTGLQELLSSLPPVETIPNLRDRHTIEQYIELIKSWPIDNYITQAMDNRVQYSRKSGFVRPHGDGSKVSCCMMPIFHNRRICKPPLCPFPEVFDENKVGGKILDILDRLNDQLNALD